MTVMQLVFLLTGLVTVVAAVLVVTSPKLIHAALWLILALIGVAITFVLLEAGFLAVVQAAVYVDAIAILIIITVMLTQRVMSGQEQQTNRNWPWALLAALLLFGGLILLVTQVDAFSIQTEPLAASSEATLEQLGRALVDVDQYVIPFEIASVLLLAALIGSIVIAMPPRPGRRKGGKR